MKANTLRNVLLIGEASGVHDALKHGLMACGVEVRHMLTYLPQQGRSSDGAFAVARGGWLGKLSRNVEPFYRIARLPRYDVVNFLNTTSAVHGLVTRYRDLPLIRNRGRLLSYYAVGCDEIGIVRRNAALDYAPCQGCQTDNGDLARDCTERMERRHERSVAEVRRHFDYAACSMVEYAHIEAAFAQVPDPIPLPIRTDTIPFVPARSGGKPIRIVHAPTRRGYKGTLVIDEAIRLLRARRSDFSFRIVEGLTHAEYLAAMRDADVVVDQVHSQSAGVSALEMLAAGKIVLTGATPMAKEYMPALASSPAFDASPRPATLAETLSEVLDRRDRFASLAELGRAYVARHHDPTAIARRFIAGWAHRLANVTARDAAP